MKLLNISNFINIKVTLLINFTQKLWRTDNEKETNKVR